MLNNGISTSKLIQLSTTGWLNRFSAIKTKLDQWLELKTFFHIAAGKEKCYSARTLSEMFGDNVNYLYLVFLKLILSDLNRTNLCFQSENIDFFRLLDELLILLLSVAKRILKPSFIEVAGKSLEHDIDIITKALDNKLASFLTH